MVDTEAGTRVGTVVDIGVDTVVDTEAGTVVDIGVDIGVGTTGEEAAATAVLRNHVCARTSLQGLAGLAPSVAPCTPSPPRHPLLLLRHRPQNSQPPLAPAPPWRHHYRPWRPPTLRQCTPRRARCTTCVGRLS